MTKKTSRLYYARFFWVFLLLLTISTYSIAQKKDKKSEDKKKITNLINQDEVPLYNGMFIGYDLSGPIYKVFSGDYLSNEVNIEFNLKNRYFPVIEMGYGSANKWSDYGVNYKTKAPYFRIGADYNFLYKKHQKNYLTGGLRYGMTKYDFDLATPPIIDGVWEEDISAAPELKHSKVASSMQWLEFVVGVRTSIFKNIYMGWSLRMKYRLSYKKSEVGNPWYVPGYGIFKDSRFGITYSIIYRIPGKKKK